MNSNSFSHQNHELKYFKNLQTKYRIFDQKFIKRVLHFGIPMGLASIIVSLMAVIDNIFIGQASSIDGQIGNYAIGATYIANWYYGLIIMLIMGFANVVTIYATQNFGAKKFAKVHQSLRLNFYVGITIATIAVICAWVFADQITSLLSATKSTKSPIIAAANRKYGAKYLKILSLTIFAYAITNPVAQLYSWNEKTKIVLWVTIAALGFNALFNYLFMFVLKIGVFGCAWSTVLVDFGIITTLSIILFFAKKWEGRFKIWQDWYYISADVVKKALRHSLIFFNQITFTSIATIANILWARVYLASPTVQGIISPFQSFFMIAMSGVLATTGTIVGKNLGQNAKAEAYANSIRITIYALFIAILGSIIFVSLSPVIPFAFSAGRNNGHVAYQASMVIIFVSITYCTWIWAMGYGMSLRVGGKTLYYTITSAGSSLIDLSIVLIIFFLRPSLEYWQAFALWKSTRLLRVAAAYYFYRKKTWLTNITNSKKAPSKRKK